MTFPKTKQGILGVVPLIYDDQELIHKKRGVVLEVDDEAGGG